jgi:hypothetical protein
MDPGDGSGTWKPADPAHPSYIQFNADGSYTSVPPQFIDADRYKILNDSVVIFIGTTIDSMPMRYHFLPATLTIYPPCYEGCGFKYIAVNP